MSQKVLDKLAELSGWTWSHKRDRWEKGSMMTTLHPIRDDLNTCVAMWDEYAGKHGWRQFKWAKIIGDKAGYAMIAENHSEPGPGKSVSVWCTGHDAAAELNDRWELLGKVLEARGI